MSDRRENPFLRYGLDPTADLATITERLRELAEDASDPREREEIRAAWEALTRSPMRRFELALEVSPAPSPLPRIEQARRIEEEPFAPRLADLLAPAPVAPRLGPVTVDEARILRIDLDFLLREDEARATGPLEDPPVRPTVDGDKGTKR